MKKKVFSIIGVAVFAVAVAFNINASISNDAESNIIALTNIEALAQGEIEVGRFCRSGVGLCAYPPILEDPYWVYVIGYFE